MKVFCSQKALAFTRFQNTIYECSIFLWYIHKCEFDLSKKLRNMITMN